MHLPHNNNNNNNNNSNIIHALHDYQNISYMYST